MQFLFELFPVLLFFVAYKVADIYVATGVAIAATIGQIGWLLFKRQKVKPMLWISLGIIVVFGGATIVLHNETFIKWKPTVLYWLFAAGLLVSQYGFKTNFIRTMMEPSMNLAEPIPESVWTRLNLSWIGFFLVMGALNIFVASRFSTDVWVNFKLFGSIGLMLVFVVVQGMFLSKHIKDPQ